MDEQQQHSRLGIASFVTSIVVGVLMFILLGIAGYLELSSPGGLDETSAAAIVIGLVMILLAAANLAALGLGIAGISQRHRRRTFGVVGTVISALIAVLTVVIIVAGSSAA